MLLYYTLPLKHVTRHPENSKNSVCDKYFNVGIIDTVIIPMKLRHFVIKYILRK